MTVLLCPACEIEMTAEVFAKVFKRHGPGRCPQCGEELVEDHEPEDDPPDDPERN